MSSTYIIILVVVLVAILLGFYIFAMVMRKKTENRILDLEERKENLFDLPVQEEIDSIKKMHLVGQSQTIFREWNQKWIDLSSNSFADLENHVFEAEDLNDSFHFFRARESVADSEGQIEVMEEEVEAIRVGIAKLTEQEKRNSNKIQESLDLYEALRNDITDNAASYGSVITEIEKQLDNIETEFSQFVTLNSTGDPIEAAEVLETAEEHTIALRAITEHIPAYIDQIEKELPKQYEELEEAYNKFKEAEYALPTSIDVEERMISITETLQNAQELLEKFELEQVENEINVAQGKIEELYSIFEREYGARRNVEKRSGVLKEYIEHTRQNNKNLLLEIDHVTQSYVLSGNEKGYVRGYQEHLEALDEEVDQVLEDIANNTAPYSQLSRKVNSVVEALEDIEKNQLKISNLLVGLKDEEKAAQEIADRFDSELRTIKRYVEKKNLPGLPKDYLDLFFMTGDRVQTLFKELNKVRINIDTINHLVDVSTEDMHVLKEATDNLVDHAILAEQLMQYANRYKTTDERVAVGISRALHLFESNQNYNSSFDEIRKTLELVEPGAAERISRVYFKDKPKADYR
ncbi:MULTISPECIES: septation ring formation regulator EzrA [unclassified Lactococcus]|uniref:septation ring formation regulator EzrA n=1 Tax=unclassified Lactococcus TaxID=2643510 RepID=UPI0011CA375D|nr:MULTISPECIES: septation ring formation regulator EzrA [unclassified Lactococcus]MQW24010.1 septation ring formation regulator EzrA [Lactococcus sp. dk101]TXK36769.1 septation ring formation regulator EzrA [Lactococcus sp. dk310]TXK47537.1 septation ring formation regulator EzrA [Lactococcus sp. dk322]